MTQVLLRTVPGSASAVRDGMEAFIRLQRPSIPCESLGTNAPDKSLGLACSQTETLFIKKKKLRLDSFTGPKKKLRWAASTVEEEFQSSSDFLKVLASSSTHVHTVPCYSV